VEERVFVEGPEERQISPDVWIEKNRRRGGMAGTGVLEIDAPEVVVLCELEVHENYIEILDRQSGQRIVTVIEVVSPTNKFAGPGRKSYLAKQEEVLASQAHLVEIDLLRVGPHVLSIPERSAQGAVAMTT
jgi:hypothetical protein